MAKKNMKKFLPRAGSTAAVALAMSAVITLQADATEILDNQPLDNTSTEPAVQNLVDATDVSSVEPAAVNEEITENNNEIVENNNEIVEDNQIIENSNDAAADENADTTGGALANPDLSLPEAPVAPDDNASTEDYNNQVDAYNKQVDEYNNAAEGYNQGVDNYNDAADAYDQAAQENYENEQQQYQEDKAAHEEAKNTYDDQTAAWDEYESKQATHDQLVKDLTDAYTAEKEIYDAEYKAEEDAFNAEKAEHEEAKNTYDDQKAAWDEYDAALDIHNDLVQNMTDAYETEKEAYDTEYKAEEQIFNQEKTAHEEAKNTYDDQKAAWDEYDAALDIHNDLVQNMTDAHTAELGNYDKTYKGLVEDYNQDLAEYEDKVEQKEIYDDVEKYNDQVELDNGAIEDLNNQLTSDLDTGAVAKLEDAKFNTDLNNELAQTDDGKALLNTLDQKNLDSLTAEETRLAAEAAALDAEAKLNHELGSEAYQNYLDRVKKFNADVEIHNGNLAAYNEAVKAYNLKVDDYNTKKEAVEGDSSTGNGYTDGVADWGNIVITNNWYGHTSNKTLDHIDVKYQAATSQTVTTDENGENPEYTENHTGYTVTGVYSSEAVAESEQAKAEKNPDYEVKYSVSYDKNGADNGGTGTQTLTKDADNVEFGGHHGGNIGFDPVKGTVNFYMTLDGEDGKPYDINVSLNSGTTYAEGSYYKAEPKDLLKYYKDSKGKGLKTEMIGGEEYFNISGQSVFVISALTCEGTTYNAHTGKIDMSFISGLDLVLNLQTMIKTHQADNAQRLTLQDLLLGKTATATDPGEPGEAPTAPTYDPPKLELPEGPKAPTFERPENDPGEWTKEMREYAPPTLNLPEGPKAPTFERPENDPGEWTKEMREYAPPSLNLPDGPEAPTFDRPENDPGAWNKAEPTQPGTTIRLEHVEELETLEKKKVALDFVIPEPEPEPVAHLDFGFGDWDNIDNDGLVNIPDEAVPLAKAPETGDLSGLWAAISSLSLGGVFFLNRKRREEV